MAVKIIIQTPSKMQKSRSDILKIGQGLGNPDAVRKIQQYAQPDSGLGDGDFKMFAMSTYARTDDRLIRPNISFSTRLYNIVRAHRDIGILLCGKAHVPRLVDPRSRRVVDIGTKERIIALGAPARTVASISIESGDRSSVV
jgi:hypothetical protein